MRQLIAATALALLATGPLLAEPTPAAAPAAAATPDAAQAKALIQQFAGTLKGELETAMKAGGPVKAIGVCKERAPAIAADLSAKSGWKIARVSLKPRNAKTGQPDAWERQVLTRFDARKAAGEPVDTLAFGAVVEDDGAKQFRFMKAIPTGEVCLACHGSAINPEVAAALDQAYPGDQARGYAVGDIRGAFSLAKPID
ncbi:DUF3365 domain-containing protein [uncultured Thiodictyon sp.]|uniref:Tll0287-like domain-containing protein n=1 Tax=uncultured Thiodictyon sp. TaxID=1846217 RepID=UPI0025DDB16E|nr:DUF3365 domain-containing protein [uncultured Thiodictyon sp.]